MAANRNQTMVQATQAVWARGGVTGFFQGLIPWVRVFLFSCRPCTNYSYLQAWIEASTKGGVLLFTATEIEDACEAMHVHPFFAGLAGGCGGGIAQAYVTMGKCFIF